MRHAPAEASIFPCHTSVVNSEIQKYIKDIPHYKRYHLACNTSIHPCAFVFMASSASFVINPCCRTINDIVLRIEGKPNLIVGMIVTRGYASSRIKTKLRTVSAPDAASFICLDVTVVDNIQSHIKRFVRASPTFRLVSASASIPAARLKWDILLPSFHRYQFPTRACH